MSSSQNKIKNVIKVEVDSRSFVKVDGVPVCKVTSDGKLQFCDKDRRRSSERGTRYVVVDPSVIVAAAKAAVDKGGGSPVDK